jgi:hypothetical protein
MSIIGAQAIYRKLSGISNPDSICGNRAVIKTEKMIILINNIIRYLNFKRNTPIINRSLVDHKIKILLRQQYGDKE